MNQMIISKLKKWIEPLSVNQVKSISPILLKKELKIENQELLDIIKFLHKERIVKYRYKFICNKCGNDCIAYERVLMKGKYSCSECGNYFSLDDVKAESQVVYEFDKDEIMKINNAEELDFTKESIGNNIVSIEAHKPIIQEEIKMETKKKKIFFGSSTEAADIMDEIAVSVATLNCTTLKWNSPSDGIFIPGNMTLDSLINTANEVDGAIFIFNADDKVWYHNDVAESTVRDNVLFEYGLFMGALGKRNVAFVCKDKPKLASDLAGVTYIDANNDPSIVKMHLKHWIQNME